MDRKVIVLTKQDPSEKCNVLSKVFFLWYRKIVKLCSSGNFKTTDLYKCLAPNKAENITSILERHWNEEITTATVKNNKPSFFRVIRKTHLSSFIFLSAVGMIQTIAVKPFQSVVLAILINIFNEEKRGNIGSLCTYGGIMVALGLVGLFVENHLYFTLSKIGMKVRIAASSLVYRKILKLSKKSLAETDLGKVINLLSNDVGLFDMVVSYIYYIWIAPLSIIITVIFIGYQMQIGGIIGEGLLLLIIIPMQILLGKSVTRWSLDAAQKTDVRVKKISKIVSGMHVIKYYAWEVPFTKLVEHIRKTEIRTISKICYLRGMTCNSSAYIQQLGLFIIVVTYVLMNNQITASKVFSVSLIINTLQVISTSMFPQALSIGAKALVSIKRLEEFLLYEEAHLPAITYNTTEEIRFENVQASWKPRTPVLQNINLVVKPGKLCAVIGPVGVGKSTLLQMLLGHLVQDKGDIVVGGSVSYSDQNPWLFSSTVKHNILFGQKYNQKLYEKIVKVCALEKDFEIFPRGDQSLVGERGISLSGGQKARINLARAVYRTADIYLFDDPLSAVDANVGKQLFENCFVDYLQNKTRILITHQLQYLHKTDHIVILNNGQIEAQGTFSDLVNLKIDFTKLHMISGKPDTSKLKNPSFDTGQRKNSIDLNSLSTKSNFPLETEFMSKPLSENCLDESDDLFPKGRNNKSVFIDYLKSGKNIRDVIVTAILLILGQVAVNSADLWITFWTKREKSISEISNSNYTSASFSGKLDLITLSNKSTILIYMAIITACILLLCSSTIIFYKFIMSASRNLHCEMFQAIIKAPLRFFETTPSGVIMNRFSRDIGIIDDTLPSVLQLAIQKSIYATKRLYTKLVVTSDGDKINNDF